MNKKALSLLMLTLALVVLVVASVVAQSGRNGGSTITLYSDSGSVIKEWKKIPGRVEFKDGMYSFVDATTDNQIQVSGTVLVTTAP